MSEPASTGRGTLLSQTGSLTAAQSKTVRTHRFRVPAEGGALALQFQYSPRASVDPERNRTLIDAAIERHARRRIDAGEATLAEMAAELDADGRSRRLANLLNVVLVDPEGRWRGRWDRSPSGTGEGRLVLGPNAASRGFVPGAIQPGWWTAAVECHGVFGDPVEYQLEIESVDPALLGAPRPPAAASTNDPAPAAGPGWYLGELHSHSTHSDGVHDVAELAEQVRARGADFLALTDHNTMSGHIDPPTLPLVLVRGCELTTFHGHHPVYGLAEMVPWHVDGRVRPLHDIAAAVRAQGGLVGVAHPFALGDPLCTGCRAPGDLDPDHFDLLEVWYRRWNSPGGDNTAARDLWIRLWERGRGPVGVAARDWHGPRQAGPFPGAEPLTAIWAEGATPDAILAGLRAGAVVMTAGPLVDLVAVDDGGAPVARTGARLDAGDALRARADVTRLDQPAELRLYRGATVIDRRPVTGAGPVELDADLSGPGAYRVELWSGAGPLAIGNHIAIGGAPR